jgi:hypothetical protein
MNYNNYSHLYRYICDDCVVSIELRSKFPIPINKEPICFCYKKMTMSSYFGPNGVPMYNGIIE